jgi:hypothetical protein
MGVTNLQGGNTMLSTGMFPPVRAASTGSPLNPAVGGLLTVDGITLAVGDRVLCKDETNAVNNGIYSVQTGPWTRTSDALSNTQFFPGMTVTVGPGGAVNAGQTFVCTSSDDPVVVGTSLITWASQSAVQNAQQSATSTTSLTIGTGSKTFAVQAGKAFQTGQFVLINETSNAANQMFGTVSSYTGTTLVVNVTATGGSGTHADWTVVLYPSGAAAGFAPPIGTGNVTGPGSAVSGNVATFNGTSGQVIQDSGVALGSLAGLSSLSAQYLASSALGYAVGMINGTLVTSIGSNALTITVKTLAGNTPSTTDPVWFLITNGSGGYTVIEQTSALSLTVPAGASLGTVSGQAGRQYVAVWNNGGTAVLGIYNSLNSTGPSILCWDETSAASGTGITSGSTLAQVWYTASSLSSKNFRVIGVLESSQSTGGQWATAVTAKLFGPGSKKPGDPVQEVPAFDSTSPSLTGTNYVALTGKTVVIPVQSAANIIRVEASGLLSANGGEQGLIRLSRGTTANTNMFGSEGTVATFGANVQTLATGVALGCDTPNTTGNVTYAVQAKSNAGGITVTFGPNTEMWATEIQI